MKPIIGKTLLTGIPHEGGKITFQHPPFKGFYGNVAEQIDGANLQRPNSLQTASLVHDAFQNPQGQYESGIINILRDSWLWEFTGNLYLPEKEGEEFHNGVILESNPTIENGKLVMDRKALTERLRNKDPSVKFVPFGYKTGKQNLLELLKNPYILARYGEQGAEKIAEIASKYKKTPRLWSFDSVNEEQTSMSALDVSCLFGSGLHVNGNYWGSDSHGDAFGVLEDKAA